MNGKIKYEFLSKMWKHDAPGGWHFVSLPQSISEEIRENLGWQEEGWGRMKATAGIKEHSWETAIWFDTKVNTYILPIKANIRKQTNLKNNKETKFVVWI